MPFPSPGDLPDLGTKPGFPPLQADSLPSEPPGSLGPSPNPLSVLALFLKPEVELRLILNPKHQQ